jgi:hypothetical protein
MFRKKQKKFLDPHLLGHVDKRFVVIKPQIVIRDTHFVKCNLLGIFKEDIRSPNILQPTDIKNSISN